MMEGLFAKAETVSKFRADTRSYSCISCGRFNDYKAPRLNAVGDFTRGILIVGENTTIQDMQRGRIFSGEDGKSLQKVLGRLGIELLTDCLLTNAVRCPSSKSVNSYSVACCRKHIKTLIAEKKPKHIIALGKLAFESLVGEKVDLGDFDKWRGFIIPDQEYNAFIYPTYNPKYLLKYDSKIMYKIWEHDLGQVISNTDPFQAITFPKVTIIDQSKAITEYLKYLCSVKWFVTDIETTGLKPQAPGHRIVCIGFTTDSEDTPVVIPELVEEKHLLLMKKVLSSKVAKIAHNLKFENNWFSWFYGIQTKGWIWDTMLTAHVLDNRTGISGLKHQTYLNFGIPDYSTEVNPFLQGIGKKEFGGNAFNQLPEKLKDPIFRKKLFDYCGYDCYFTKLLFLKQKKIIENQNFEI